MQAWHVGMKPARPTTPLLLASSAPRRFCSPEAFSPSLLALLSGKSECMEDKRRVRVRCVHRSFVPLLMFERTGVFPPVSFFPVEAIYFPSFPSFVLSFFRWFFWQQAINPIIGLAEPLSAPPLSTALPYLSLSLRRDRAYFLSRPTTRPPVGNA